MRKAGFGVLVVPLMGTGSQQGAWLRLAPVKRFEPNRSVLCYVAGGNIVNISLFTEFIEGEARSSSP